MEVKLDEGGNDGCVVERKGSEERDDYQQTSRHADGGYKKSP